MIITKHVEFSDDEASVLVNAGRLLRELVTKLSTGEVDTISENSSKLVNAFSQVITELATALKVNDK